MKKLLFVIFILHFPFSCAPVGAQAQSGTILHSQTVAKYKGNAKAAISYTFDDGLLEDYTVVWPKLKEMGIKGTFWIIGSAIDKNKKLREAPVMTWEQVAEMAKQGQEMSSHTYDHVNMTTLDQAGWAREIDKNDSAIFKHTGIHPQTLAFPGNRKSPELLAYIDSRKDLIASRNEQKSMGGKFACGGSSSLPNNGRAGGGFPFDKLLQKTLKDGLWTVTMTHGILKGYDCFANQEQADELWKHIAAAKALADKGELWIAPFKDVAAYLNGKSAEVTYILGDTKPTSVKQGDKTLKPYQSWDGKWCVDGLRNMTISVK